MKNKKDSKKEQVREIYSNIKTAWANPRKKAGIKLLGYLIFFIVLFLFAAITSNINEYKTTINKTSTTTTTSPDKYIDKQKSLLTNKYNINYIININSVEYKINGTIDNNIVNGYFETPDGIKKIIFKDSILYEINNQEETLLESELNNNLIDINYIINLIKQNSAIISDNEETKTYTYNINNLNIVVTTNEESILKININELTNTYILNFDN